MGKKLRVLFHDETNEVHLADAFEVEGNVLHIWRQGYGLQRFGEIWYPLNSLRGWGWVEG